MSSSEKEVLVLPVPETARKKTMPGIWITYDMHITVTAGTDAFISSGISVYIPVTASGNIQKAATTSIIVQYEIFNILFISGMTMSWWPSPMMLLTRVLHVEEND